MPILRLILLQLALFGAVSHLAAADPAPRAKLVRAVLAEDAAAQEALIKELIGAEDPMIVQALTAWRGGSLYLYETNDTRIPFLLDPQPDADGRAKGIRVLDGEYLKDGAGQPLLFAITDLSPADANSKLRRVIKTALDLFALGNSNPKMRRDAAIKLGQEQNPDYLPHFGARHTSEQDPEVRRALREAIALTQAASEDAAVRLPAIKRLGEMRSINSLNFLQELEEKAAAEPVKYGPETLKAAHAAVVRIQNYIWWGNLAGTAFRGLSLAAVLLVAALGLAITFGLMGVINMAHGEIMAVGAYTAFVVQGLLGKGLLLSLAGKPVPLKGLGLTGGAFDAYFLVALAVSFFTAALVGLALERGIIRFLYKRPLESLLATWGVSLILQQVFRHTFGAANVQVDAPSFLSGSLVLYDVLFAYNRLFILGFAGFIVAGTYLLLTRTALGLQIRAVMQNRAMASCLGVRTDRVNMMTFALGSGLAGMAGACLSQIANVGPSLGQSYIIDCFMVVVLGGVGNLVGTVSAAAGIGITDQILQPWLGAVLGKITVLGGIILFLQWRPAGLFVTRSRGLDA
ncbi:MAG TPA: urea ABC transporter permease subunit UrtB [Methylomirabilota bacterium]|nr:urea ABC transporter permease subunit UrtB [Methylomirabilota bacterium]